MTVPESSKSAMRLVQTEGEMMDDSLDALRHNQTHTIPPGTRLAWISEPLADLPEEHLRATNETTRAALGLSSDDSEEKISRKSLRRLALAIACALVFLGGSWSIYLLTNREAPRTGTGSKLPTASSEPSTSSRPSVAGTASARVLVPATNGTRATVPAAPIDQSPVQKSRKQKQPAGTAKQAPKNPTGTEDNPKSNDFLFKPR